MKKYSILISCLVIILLGCIHLSFSKGKKDKPTICILGGTPSTKDILNLIPDSIKGNYNFISFNRPGFGGSKNEELTKTMLFKLAKDAGLKKNDFGIIGISGGAPLSILIASEFNLKHCGIISGMVSREAFFQYEKKAITSGIMKTALTDFKNFEATALQFPNLDEIVKQAGAASNGIALRACFDEFNFILEDNLFPKTKENTISIDWWHGEEDVNVPIESVELFLKDFPKASLNKIANTNHAIDANIYISKTLRSWK
jgi:pimeloyl-ACP methyl ester carboxylesterase